MVLPEKKQQPSKADVAPKPTTPPSGAKEPSPQKDTSIFGGRQHISMNELGWSLRKKAPPSVPGFSGVYSEKERIDVAQDLSKRFGSHLRQRDLPRLFKDLEMEKSRAKSSDEKWRIEKEIRFLKRELSDKGKLPGV